MHEGRMIRATGSGEAKAPASDPVNSSVRRSINDHPSRRRRRRLRVMNHPEGRPKPPDTSEGQQVGNPPPGPGTRKHQDFKPGPDPVGEGLDLEDALRDALVNVVTVPITNVVMAGIMPLDSGSENVTAGEQINKVSGMFEAVVDPARIPSALVEKAVTHLLTPIAAAAFGPAGPIIAMFVGNFADELTHQVLDAGRDSAGIQFAESAIELTGAFADAQIGRLAESQPFSEYISGLVSQQIVAIVSGDADAGPSARHKAQSVPGQASAITAVVAVYEVDTLQSRSRPVSSAGSTTMQVRPALFAVLECIPAKSVVERWSWGLYEYLRLADGTLLRRRIGKDRPGRWTWVTS